MQKVKNILIALRLCYSSNRSHLSGIVSASGFNNQDHAKRLFRKIYGMSMRDYRKMRKPAP